MKKNAWIFDIDGTLANTDHRIHLIKPPEGTKKNWGKFFAEAEKDEPYQHVLRINEMVAQTEAELILITARPGNLHADTMDWLIKNHVTFNMLFMRPVNERKPDFEVKRDIYRHEIEPHFNVLAAFEDRLQVAKMWREEGVPVFLCGDEWLKQDWSE